MPGDGSLFESSENEEEEDTKSEVTTKSQDSEKTSDKNPEKSNPANNSNNEKSTRLNNKTSKSSEKNIENSKNSSGNATSFNSHNSGARKTPPNLSPRPILRKRKSPPKEKIPTWAHLGSFLIEEGYDGKYFSQSDDILENLDSEKVSTRRSFKDNATHFSRNLDFGNLTKNLRRKKRSKSGLSESSEGDSSSVPSSSGNDKKRFFSGNEHGVGWG